MLEGKKPSGKSKYSKKRQEQARGKYRPTSPFYTPEQRTPQRFVPSVGEP